MKRFLILITFICAINSPAYAQSYGVVRENCVIESDTGKAKAFSCRVMFSDNLVSFIDNYNNDERYIVGAPDGGVSNGEVYNFQALNKKCMRHSGMKVTICKIGKGYTYRGKKFKE